SPTEEAVTTNDSVGCRVNAIPLINSRIGHFSNIRPGNRPTGTPRRSRVESIHVVEDRHKEKLQVHRKHAQEERHTHEDCNRQITTLRRVTDCGDETDKQSTPQNHDRPLDWRQVFQKMRATNTLRGWFCASIQIFHHEMQYWFDHEQNLSTALRRKPA